jgi:uncharacterized protein YvpB
MRKSVRFSILNTSFLSLALCVIVGCKSRANVADSMVSAASAINSGCKLIVSSDTASVASTSLIDLIARDKNQSCNAKILRLPLVRQAKGFTCAATSLQSILFYYGDFFTETELQRILRSHKDYGTSYKRILRFFNGLNDKDRRETITSVYGFDSKVELSDLEVVLKDPAVFAAIEAKAKTSPMHASVLKGIEDLRSDAIDIDKLGSLSTSFGLTAADTASAVDDSNAADSGHRVQSRPKRKAEPHQNKYALRLFFESKPYNHPGAMPVGCPSPTVATNSEKIGPTRAMTLNDLAQAIDAGHPVLALTQAWTYTNDKDYDISEYEKAWYSGHYVVVIGYDEHNIYYMDPYNMGHYAFLPKDEWEKRWHDYDGFLADDGVTRCPGGSELHHFGLVIARDRGPAYDPDRITKMY